MESIGDFCYDTTKILGQGSFGIVFKGWIKQQPSVQVAVKRIEKKRISEELLDREIEVLRELSVYQHENVVALLDIKKTETCVFLIMEFCNGGNLADYLRHKRTLSENTLSSFMQQIGSALKAMKDKGIMHRDLKPQNILICYAKGRNNLSTPPTQLQLKIADFGFARFLEEGKMASTLCGSAVYVAPEVIKCEKYDFKVDLWSVGAIIFECLTGEVPFVKEIRDLRAFYEKNVDLKPEIPEDASPELKDMLQRLLTINAKERIDIEELLQHPFLKRFKETPSKGESTCEKKGSTVRAPLAKDYNGSDALFMGGRVSGSSQTRCPAMALHVKARCEVYPRTSDVIRFPVPDDMVPWNVDFPGYEPVDYTAPSVEKRPVWADPDFRKEKEIKPKWNSLDGKVNRKSHENRYELDDEGVPKNPCGRTGLRGRGLLGRWGPNHAADPIVTRWKRDSNDEKVKNGNKFVAQFIAVQRRDNNEWAIPGGMVDPGEVITTTIRREFGEETLNTLNASPEEKKMIEKNIDDLFCQGKEIYRGYVDDPRNTDNAWMETIAMNFHDECGDSVAKFKLHAGDDAVGVKWLDLDSSLQLYASHVDFLRKTAEHLNASW